MEAFITLATNDSYCLGACTLAYSLRRSGTTRQLAVMITSSVSEDMRKVLAKVFDHVEMVDLLHSGDPAGLKLLDRQDLGGTFTKLHCWKMTQYSKAVFMDADTLVIRNIDDIFEREEFSAAPDPGWPDCFNSGVFVFRPSLETYGNLLDFAVEHGSFDGADQGLLNRFFSDWATKDIARHLPFLYNCSMWEFYSYLPALREYRSQVRVVHFIGPVKPWHQSIHDSGPSDERTVYKNDFLRQWWGAFAAGVQPLFSTELGSKYARTLTKESVDHKSLPSSSILDSISRVSIKFPEPVVEILKPPLSLPLSTHKVLKPSDDGAKTSDLDTPEVTKRPELSKDADHLSVGAASGDTTPVSSASASQYSYGSSEKITTLSSDSEPSPVHVSKFVKKIADNVGALYMESRYEESHREAWEHGQIDYLGVDSFDNILARLDKSIKSKNPGIIKSPKTTSKVPKEPKGIMKHGKFSKEFDRRSDDGQVDEEVSSLTHLKK